MSQKEVLPIKMKQNKLILSLRSEIRQYGPKHIKSTISIITKEATCNQIYHENTKWSITNQNNAKQIQRMKHLN